MSFDKLVVSFLLIPILLLTNMACLKRVAIFPRSEGIKSHQDIIYVYMRPGVEYKGNASLHVKNSKLKGEYLLGTVENEEVNIALDDIGYIEVFRIDKEKVALYSVTIIVLTIYGLHKYAPGLEIN